MTIADKLQQIAERVPIVYEEGFEEGRKNEYDRCWDAFQDFGNRTAYAYGFSNKGWNDETFKPKYPIVCVGSSAYIFRDSDVACSETPLQIDTSQATTMAGTFYSTKLVLFK